MGILQKKRRTTENKALAYRPKGGQNTDIACLALRLRVVLDLLLFCDYDCGFLTHVENRSDFFGPKSVFPHEKP